VPELRSQIPGFRNLAVFSAIFVLGVHTDLIHGLEDFKEKTTNPSLRFFRRFKKIEKLTPLKQENILRTIDDLIKAAEK